MDQQSLANQPGGVFVNVNGSNGEFTRDPVTGEWIINVTTDPTKAISGTTAAGSSIGSVTTSIFAGLPSWAPFVLTVGAFGLIVLAMFKVRRK